MSRSFIEELASKRRSLLDGLDANDGDINLDIFEDFYPDKAHFIFELLQNAEDAGATTAFFRLTQEGCFFEHDGTRFFTESDVRAITGIHNSTKSKSEDKIGKFGVGFKSVFVYTHTPHVWSGDFSFKISRLVLPEFIQKDQNVGTKTRFWFPFDNPEKKQEAAYSEVESGLKDLAETTLLFLSNLETIDWQNATKESAKLFRTKHSENHFEVLKQTGGKTNRSCHFLKFDQPVIGLSNNQRVAVAYSLGTLSNELKFDSKIPLLKQLKIIPANPGQVAVFFPAEKETSGLRFHLHAPFVPELSRASIKETSANLPLFKQLASLAAESLHHIRDLGLLTTDFLAVLPNPQDSIPKRYEDIRKAIVTAMNEQPLTPTHAKSHAPAKNLLQAKASLKNFLTTDDIHFLVDDDDEPPQWAAAASQKNSNADRFLTGLAIKTWDVEEFIELLDEKADTSYSEPDEDFMAWLSGKSLEWHQQFYAFLYKELQPDEEWYRLNNLNIIRLNNGGYSRGAECFFPTDDVEQDEVHPRVDKNVYSSGSSKSQQDSARKFLEEIGVREVGETEQVEAILKQRYVTNNINPQKGDLKRFISLFEKEPDKARLFKEYYIFEGKDGKYIKPSHVFLDKPFIDTGLSAYFDMFVDKSQCFALADSYLDSEINIKSLVQFAEAVGVQTKLSITKANCIKNPDRSYLFSAPGSRSTSPINEDYTIAGLDKVLEQPTLRISKLLWNTMCSLKPYSNYLEARYRHNKSSGFHYAPSQLVHSLSKAAWVPQGDGKFVRPAEATRELLPEGFPFDSGWQWLKAINFGEDAIKKSELFRQKQYKAQELGFESADRAAKWAELEKLGVSPEELIAKYKKRELPDKESVNQERRATKIITETRSSPEKTKEFRERSIDPEYGVSQDEARTYLKHQYTHDDGLMFCQLCQAPQPVMLNGNPHFEAVTCVADMNKHTAQNNLALCPNHAAMYKKSDLTPDIIQQAILDCEEQTIPLNLAGNQVELYFTQQHIRDLQATLRALQDSEI